MATTALFVEIIVIGALAEMWFVTALLAFLDTSQVKAIVAAAVSVKDFASLGAVLLLALTYAVGWVLNFVAERSFKVFFQHRVRDPIFHGEPMRYDEARAIVFQQGSSELLHDLLLDRHIIRIARSNVFNFTLIAVGLILNYRRLDARVVYMVALSSIAVACLSYAQWRTRYEEYYRKVSSSASLIQRAKTSG